MAVAYLTFKPGDPVVVWCLSTDPKPAAQSTWTLLETDTGNRFTPNGTAWAAVSGGGGVAWGGVTGTLSAQTDLQNALNAKQASGSYQPLATPLTNTTASFTTAQETKLSGIAAAATANATDAALRDRATHTGAQAISTVTGLQAAIDAKATIASVPNASYRSLLDCTASHIAARVAGTYWFGQGNAAGITGTGTLYAPNLLYIDSADYPTLDGVAPKLRIRAQIYVNDAAPTGNFTLGLYPVTRPATSGAAGLNIYTMGTVVAGSTVAVSAPAADSANILVGADFALPANGHYVLGMVTTATVAVSSHLHLSALLQMRNA